MASSLLYAAFFLSGFTALLYEIVWQRLLVRITGATMPATVAIFSLFMLGLALGSFFSIKYCEKSLRPWKIYALLELLVACMGLFILYLSEQSTLEFINTSLGTVPAYFAIRAHLVFLFAAVASVAVTVATASMGAAFNFGIRALLLQISENASSGKDDIRQSIERVVAINRAYSSNVCGAAIGSLCGAFICLPAFGLTITAFVACALQIFLAIGLWLGQFKYESKSSVEAPVVEQKSRIFASILALIFSFSVVSMSLEVTWTRLLCLICGSSTYAVGSVLVAVLLSLAAGAVLTNRIANEPRFSLRLLGGVAGCAALFLSFDLLTLPFLTWSILWLQNFLASLSCLVSLQFFLPRILTAFVLISGTAFPLGVLTALLIKLANGEQQSVRVTALALTSSTAGSILGALITAFLIISNDYFVSGIETAIILSVCALSLLAVICLRLSSGKFNIKSMLDIEGCLILISLLAVIVHPHWEPSLMSLGPSFVETTKRTLLSFQKFKSSFAHSGEKCLFYKEGSSATVTVETNEQANVIFLKSNGKVESALPLDWLRIAPTSDYKTQLFMGIVPVLEHRQNVHDLNALIIGFGSGITSGLLLSFDQIAHLTTCEIEPVIYRCAHFFDNSNFQPLRSEWLHNGRVKPVCADARAYLNQNNALFDIIISQPSEPWISGSSDLFTLEFFRLVKTRMNADGIFVQWLQLYCIDEDLLTNLIATFQQVFPDTYILHPRNSGDVILVGLRGKEVPPEVFVKNIDRDLRESGMSRSVRETLSQTVAPSGHVLDCDFILTPFEVASFLVAHNNVQLNTDGRIATEYQLPQELMLGETHINNNIDQLKSLRGHR